MTTMATKSHLSPSSSFTADIRKDFNALETAASRGDINQLLALQSKIQGTIQTATLLHKEGAIKEGPQFQKELNEWQSKTTLLVSQAFEKTQIPTDADFEKLNEELKTGIAQIKTSADAVKISDEITQIRLKISSDPDFVSNPKRLEKWQTQLFNLRDLIHSRLDALSQLETIRANAALVSPETLLIPIAELKKNAKDFPDILRQLEEIEGSCKRTILAASKREKEESTKKETQSNYLNSLLGSFSNWLTTSIASATPITTQWSLPPVGLDNPSCNCWANSVLQLVANSPVFWQRLQLLKMQLVGKDDRASQEKLAKLEHLQQILCNYYAAQQNKQVGSTQIGHNLRSWTPNVSRLDSSQEDAEVAASTILAELGMNFDIEQTLTITNWDKAKKKNPDIRKKPVSTTTYKESMMHVNFGSGERHLGKLMKTCYSEIVQTERVTKKNQNYYQQAKQSRIKSAPQELCVQAVRFDYSGTHVRKINDILTVPRQYIMEEREVVDGQVASYDLTGVIIHIGDSIEHGHYVSVVKKSDGWYLCNDKTVSAVSGKELEKFLSQGYIFQYTKSTK